MYAIGVRAPRLIARNTAPLDTPKIAAAAPEVM
jgi:hypothetical protein